MFAEHLKVGEHQIANGAIPNLENEIGVTEPQTPSRNDYLDVVEHLITNGPDPNLKDENGDTALHRNSYMGNLEVVTHLIANGADPELKNKNNLTALQIALNRVNKGLSYERSAILYQESCIYTPYHFIFGQ